MYFREILLTEKKSEIDPIFNDPVHAPNPGFLLICNDRNEDPYPNFAHHNFSGRRIMIEAKQANYPFPMKYRHYEGLLNEK